MRFHAGLPPDEFEPDSTWSALREPAPRVAARRSLPMGLGLVSAAWLCWHALGASPLAPARFDAGWSSALGILAGFASLIVVHEFVHVCLHPRLGASRSTVVGASLRPLMFYAAYQDQLSRNRFIAMLLAPLLVLTLAPMLAHGSGLIGDAFVDAAALASTVNAAMASLDVYGALLLAGQVPGDALVRNKGWQTYWRRGRPDPVARDEGQCIATLSPCSTGASAEPTPRRFSERSGPATSGSAAKDV